MTNITAQHRAAFEALTVTAHHLLKPPIIANKRRIKMPGTRSRKQARGENVSADL
jgi:hypothetical protein